MPPGRSSWLARTVGLARSRQLLRRSLELDGTAVATVIARPLVVAEPAR
jgi:hypothetical protein